MLTMLKTLVISINYHKPAPFKGKQKRFYNRETMAALKYKIPPSRELK